MTNPTKIKELLDEIESNLDSFDFFPDFEPTNHSDDEALAAMWECPFTETEVRACIVFDTSMESLSDLHEESHEEELDCFDDSAVDDAKADLNDENELCLQLQLRLEIANHLRSLLGLPLRKESWTDEEQREADAEMQPQLPL